MPITKSENKAVTIRRRRVTRNNNLVEYDPTDDYEIPHSGTVNEETGIPKFDQSPVRGARIMTNDGTLVNHKGRPIDEDGNIINPDQYKTDDDLYN